MSQVYCVEYSRGGLIKNKHITHEKYNIKEVSIKLLYSRHIIGCKWDILHYSYRNVPFATYLMGTG